MRRVPANEENNICINVNIRIRININIFTSKNDNSIIKNLVNIIIFFNVIINKNININISGPSGSFFLLGVISLLDAK